MKGKSKKWRRIADERATKGGKKKRARREKEGEKTDIAGEKGRGQREEKRRGGCQERGQRRVRSGLRGSDKEMPYEGFRRT